MARSGLSSTGFVWTCRAVRALSVRSVWCAETGFSAAVAEGRLHLWRGRQPMAHRGRRTRLLSLTDETQNTCVTTESRHRGNRSSRPRLGRRLLTRSLCLEWKSLGRGDPPKIWGAACVARRGVPRCIRLPLVVRRGRRGVSWSLGGARGGGPAGRRPGPPPAQRSDPRGCPRASRTGWDRNGCFLRRRWPMSGRTNVLVQGRGGARACSPSGPPEPCAPSTECGECRLTPSGLREEPQRRIQVCASGRLFGRPEGGLGGGRPTSW